MGRTTMAKQQLRRGWTTGACATAAVKAAYTALLTGRFPDPVVITLPGGETPAFALALEGKGEDWAEKGVVGREWVEAHGGQVVLAPLVDGKSTTSILERAKKNG